MTFLRFLKRLITDSPVKMIFLLAGITSFFIVRDVSKERVEYGVISSFTNDGVENYVVRGKSSEKGYSVTTLDKDNDVLKTLVFPDGTTRTKIYSNEFTVTCVLLWILFILCCIVTIVGFFAGSDGGWEAKGHWFDA